MVSFSCNKHRTDYTWTNASIWEAGTTGTDWSQYTCACSWTTTTSRDEYVIYRPDFYSINGLRFTNKKEANRYFTRMSWVYEKEMKPTKKVDKSQVYYIRRYSIGMRQKINNKRRYGLQRLI